MYNKVIQIGNLTRDIELKYTPSGLAIAKSSIATTHKYKAQDGSQKEEVCFLEFNIMGKMAETANQYLRKGSKVMLEGRLIFEQWQGSDGLPKNKHTLRVETMKMLDSKPQSDYAGQTQQHQQSYLQPEQNLYNQPQQNHGATQYEPSQTQPQQGYSSNEDNNEIPF